jgi:hypothetical protein
MPIRAKRASLEEKFSFEMAEAVSCAKRALDG